MSVYATSAGAILNSAYRPTVNSGQPDYGGDGRWRAFDPYRRIGGANTTGVVVYPGVLNPELRKGWKGGRIWTKMKLQDRIDAIIAHEYEELRAGGEHAEAIKIKSAAKTELPISDKARRLNRARVRQRPAARPSARSLS
jgi:hypothetical protein